jgi:hypothetical protein
MATRTSDTFSAAQACTRFCEAFQADLAMRMPKGHRLVAALGTPSCLYRLKDDIDPVEADRVRLRDLLARPADRWCGVADLTELAGRLLGQVIGLERLDDWSVATMPYVVSSALSYAGRLMTQLGASLQTEYRMPLGRHLGADASVGLSRARELHRKYKNKLAEAMGAGTRGRRRPAAMLRFSLRAGNRICLEKLDGQGNVLERESLQRFLKKVSLPLLSGIGVELGHLLECKKEYEAATLRGTSLFPGGISEAVIKACTQRSCVHLLLGTARLKSTIPVSIWLYLDPGGRRYGGSAACALSVHRAHQEFVLQGPPPASQLSYFPPALLVARLVFTADGVSVNPPLVRQPAGGHAWCHPYTGALGAEAFAPTAPEDECEPAQYAPSAAAMKLFPELAARTKTALENDLCLAGQPERVQRLIGPFMRSTYAPESMDVLALVEGLHSIAKLGLTCGHQLNTSTPRARSEAMLYVLLARDLSITGAPFARRVFPYDPRQTRSFVAYP